MVTSDAHFNAFALHNDVTLFCSSEGGPNNTYEWRKGQILLDNEVDDTMTLYNIDNTSAGNYSCTVSNPAGQDSISIFVFIQPYIVNPLAESVQVFNGSSVNITCEADGFPRPNVSWMNESTKVSNTSLLNFDPVLVTNQGLYRCVATINVDGTSFTATDEIFLIGKCEQDPVSRVCLEIEGKYLSTPFIAVSVL